MKDNGKRDGRGKGRDVQVEMASALPPHNWEAEEALLGSILVDPDIILSVGQALNTGDFYREKNAWIYEAMIKLGSECNQITLSHELQTAGRLEMVGGPEFLSRLVERCPTSLYADSYAKVVRDLAFFRKVVSLAAAVAAKGYAAQGEPAALFEELHAMVNELQPGQITDIVGPKEHAERLLQMLTKRREKTEDPVRFGWPGLDRFLGGLYPGDLVVIGARPYMGKSEVLFETALHNTVSRDPESPHSGVKRVLVASAEMSVEEFDEREAAMLGVGIDQLRSGQLEDTQWDRLFALVGEISERPMYFLEGRLTIDHIYNRARLLKATEGLDLVIIDYIQLLRDTVVRKGDSATRERVSAISAGMKQMAQELKVPVITASQLNREVEFRKDKMPVLADLRESGSIEQDADVVLMCYRDDYYHDDSPFKGLAEVLIRKQRMGPLGDVRLAFQGEFSRFCDADQREFAEAAARAAQTRPARSGRRGFDG